MFPFSIIVGPVELIMIAVLFALFVLPMIVVTGIICFLVASKTKKEE